MPRFARGLEVKAEGRKSEWPQGVGVLRRYGISWQASRVGVDGMWCVGECCVDEVVVFCAAM